MISLPVLPYAGDNLLTHSRMSTYKTCPRKCYFSYELAIRPMNEAKPLRFGSATHEGLDLMAKREPDYAELAVAKYAELPDWCRTDELLHKWAIERITVIELLKGYEWYWKDQDAGIEIIESEKVFNVAIKHPESGRTAPAFRLGGKRDKIVRLPNGRTKLREHKTTSEDLIPGSDYWKRWRIDQQISTYYIACEAEGISIDTVEIDAIRKPTIGPLQIPILDSDGKKIVNDNQGMRVFKANGDPRQSGDASQGYVLQSRIQTPEEFAARLAEDIRFRPEWYYRREDIPRLRADLGEFSDEIWQIQQQYGDSQRKGRWFRNTSACRSFGTACAYFNICTNGIPLTADGDLPIGFVRVENVHQELMETP